MTKQQSAEINEFIKAHGNESNKTIAAQLTQYKVNSEIIRKRRFRLGIAEIPEVRSKNDPQTVDDLRAKRKEAADHSSDKRHINTLLKEKEKNISALMK